MMTPTPNTQTKHLLAHLTLAGAAALAGSTANAQITVVNVNETVGFGAGDIGSFTSSLPGIAQFKGGPHIAIPRTARSSAHYPAQYAVDRP
jgi:hypothetical protein